MGTRTIGKVTVTTAKDSVRNRERAQRARQMTVSELIVKLCDMNPTQEIEVKVRVHTRAHAVASVTPFEVDNAGIWISLPANMHVVERKGGA